MQRWILLATISIFGFFNGVVNELAAVLSTMTALLDISLESYAYLNQVLSHINPIVALPSAWFVDRYGWRAACYFSMLLVLVRNGARTLLFLPDLDHWNELKLIYFVLAGIAERIVISMYFCLPLKLAELWFVNKTERSFAWCCMAVCPSLGCTMVAFIEPYFIKGVSTVAPLAYLNTISMLLTFSAVAVGLQTVTEPSLKASSHGGAIVCESGALSERQQQVAQLSKQPLWLGIKLLMLNTNVMLHMLTKSVFESMETLIRSLLQDILGAVGFSHLFCGYLLSGLMAVYCFVQLAGSFLVADTSGEKGNVYRCKIYILFQWIAFSLYATSLILRLPAEMATTVHGPLLIASALVYNSCRAWVRPSLNNLLAHMVAGSTSAATLNAMSDIMDFFVSNLLTIAFVQLRQAGRDHGEGERANYWYSIVFLMATAAMSSLSYLIFFKATNERAIGEKPGDITEGQATCKKSESSATLVAEMQTSNV